MKNYHILQISYISPNNRVMYPRIRIKSQRFHQSIIIPFQNDPGGDTHIVANAAVYLERIGFTLIGKGEGGDNCDYIVTDTFKPLKP